MIRSLLALVLLAGANAHAAPAEVTFELKAKIRSFSVDADLWAGARLGFDADPQEGGGTKFALTRVAESPWKFYWVSPAVGSAEAKFATEATFAEASWPARQAAEKDAETRGRAKHAEWTKAWGGKRPFDQAFTFFVIGAPAGRFRFESSPTGAVGPVTNRLTNRWLPNGFPDWVAGKGEQGYAFWANDAQPPAWEPHTWHAVEKALRLLACDALQQGVVAAAASWTKECPALTAGARDVVETLAPKTKGRLALDAPKSLQFQSFLRDGRLESTGTSGGAKPVVVRKVVSDGARIRSDQLSLELADGGAEIRLQIGWALK